MNFHRSPKHRHSLYVKSSTDSPRDDRSTISSEGNIEVCVRMRPLLQPYEDEVVWEIDEESKTIKSKIENVDLKSLNLSHPKYYSDFANTQKFIYDNVESVDSKNKDIYNKLFKKIVNSVVSGYNGTIFMYGQTTSGKTFTMLGTQKDPGVLPHSLRTIFHEIQKKNGFTFTLSVSYLEIYNETISDLLVPDSTNLKIVDDPMYGVVVKGLKRQEVSCFEDAIYLMSYGEEHRKYRETNVNEHSSRSHTIYQVFIESFQETLDQGKIRRFSCLNLVDLAGSERLSDNGGLTDLQTGETGHINKSLFLLTNVIKKLADGNKAHIPYRDSKLTRILSNALGGNSLTSVVCTISPALLNYAQTLSTLRFASRAKKVKNDPTENMVQERVDQKLKEEVEILRSKLRESEGQVTNVKKLNVKLEENLFMTKQEIKSLQKEMEELRAMFIRESSRQQAEDNLSSTSLLDIIGEGVPLQKNKSSKRSTMIVTPQTLSQTSELFFGDQILSAVEQIINENSTLLTTGGSIENGLLENNNPKEWSAQCLKAKYNYLRELRNLQKNYVGTIDEVSQKYISKNQYNEVDSTIKAYVGLEFQKLEGIQARINDAIKRISPNSLDNELEIKEEQPNQNFETSKGGMQGSDNSTKQYYDNVLNRMEKKYDEIYNLLTQSFIKGKDNSIISPEALDLDKKYSNYTSLSASPIPDRSRYAQSEEEFGFRNSENPVPAIRLTESAKFSHGSIQNIQNDDKQPLSAGRRVFRFESMFSKLKTDKDFSRKSINSLTEFNSGNVFLWGSGKDGRLGNGRNTNESTPVAIKDIKFSKVVCGYHNTFGVSFDGLVYGWGRNENGQLGVGSNLNAPIPINVTSLNSITIIDIACGWQHCLALSNNGRLFSWGCGDEGQLGHGDNFEVLTPTEIRFFEQAHVDKIACGHSQSAAITSEGSLYTWGHNSDCRLMNSETNSQFIPTLTEFHKLRAESSNKEDLEIVSLSMGATHMCLVTKNGKVYTAGRGNEGQLGQKLSKDMKNVICLNPEIENDEETYEEETLCCYLHEVDGFGEENIAKISVCGEKFTLILNNKGLVYSFGDPSDGCLGREADVLQPKLIEKLADKKIKILAAGPRHAACVSEEGELYCWGFNYYDQLEVGEIEKNYHIPKKIDKLSKFNVVAISCGYFHTASVVV